MKDATTCLGESEFRALLDLTSELGEMPQDPWARRFHAAKRLSRMVGAVGATVFEIDFRGGTPRAAAGTILHTDLSNTEAARVDHYLLTGSPVDPMAEHLLKAEGTSVTMMRRQLVRDHEWYRHPHFNQVRRPLGVDDSIYSRVTLSDGTWLCMAIQRALGDDAFTERDLRLVDMFQQAAARLYLASTPNAAPAKVGPRIAEHRVDALAPRLRPVLNRLLDGDSEKQASMKLGLSPHTVHQYVKTLYKHFQVSSRGELLSQFVSLAS